MGKSKKVGVLLTGAGFYDGTDIQEAVFTLLALDKYDCDSICIAPDALQSSVVNHFTGEDISQTRNIRDEVARLTKGKVYSLKEIDPDELDALVIPGGFGVTKNLTSTQEIFQDLSRLIKGIYNAQKPLAAVCLSPNVLANTLKEIGIETELNKLSEKNTQESKEIAEDGLFDEKNKIITSPCYTRDASIALIYLGVENTIIKLTQLCNKR
jgi:enhancing lycopene biosynthesis protein 2